MAMDGALVKENNVQSPRISKREPAWAALSTTLAGIFTLVSIGIAANLYTSLTLELLTLPVPANLPYFSFSVLTRTNSLTIRVELAVAERASSQRHKRGLQPLHRLGA